MLSVLFEVHPKPDQWDTYLGYAKMLKPELERVEGFVDNIRYRSLTREGWLLSLSGWHDEKALVRWPDGERLRRIRIVRDYGSSSAARRRNITRTGGAPALPARLHP